MLEAMLYHIIINLKTNHGPGACLHPMLCQRMHNFNRSHETNILTQPISLSFKMQWVLFAIIAINQHCIAFFWSIFKSNDETSSSVWWYWRGPGGVASRSFLKRFGPILTSSVKWQDKPNTWLCSNFSTAHNYVDAVGDLEFYLWSYSHFFRAKWLGKLKRDLLSKVAQMTLEQRKSEHFRFSQSYLWWYEDNDNHKW